MDFLSSADRSRRMSLIRKKDTKPEIIVRSLAHHMGYRFRLHRNDLPGTPDLVFPSLRKAIDVRGCFWHSHSCRSGKPPVASRVAYWYPKLLRNVERDRENLQRLRACGWQVLVLWECQTKDKKRLASRLKCFLEGRNRSARRA